MTQAITNPMEMAGSTILVTGASSGIGRDTAILVSELGARVILSGRDEARLNQTAKSLHGEGHVVAAFDMENVDALVDWIRKLAAENGPIDGIAHCAGIQIDAPLRLASTTTLERLFRINTITPVMLLRGFQSPGVNPGRGSVVFISSTAALTACVSNGPYGGSKAALHALARTFAIELIGKNIRVNCVAAGLTDTEMAAHTRERFGEEGFRRLVDAHPLGLGKPRHISHAIAFLLAPTGEWITGSTLLVDGGVTAP